MNTYETLSQAIESLKKNGYASDFNLHSEWIECSSTQTRLGPTDFHVDAIYRFEGMTNPDDSSVLYAISSPMGLKGVLVDAYGVYAESISPAMIGKLKIDDKTRP